MIHLRTLRCRDEPGFSEWARRGSYKRETGMSQSERVIHDGSRFSSFQSLSLVRLFVTPWIAARQASLSITNSWSPPKPISIESVMPSSHLILCHPLLLLPPILPSIRVFSSESTLHMRWPEYWSFGFNISPSNEHLGSRLDLCMSRSQWMWAAPRR